MNNTKKVLFYARINKGNLALGGFQKLCIYDFSEGYPNPICSGTHTPASTRGEREVCSHALAFYLYNNGQPLLSKEWPTTAEEVAKIGSTRTANGLNFANIDFRPFPDAEDQFGKPTTKQLEQRAHSWNKNQHTPLAPVPADFGK